MSIVAPENAIAYRDAGWWADDTFADVVADHARSRPESVAYWSSDGVVATWADLERSSARLAAQLVLNGLPIGGRVAVWLEDTPVLHAMFLAVERSAGAIVGVGSRSGHREVVHLLAETGADILVVDAAHCGDRLDTVLAEVSRQRSIDCVVLAGDGRLRKVNLGGADWSPEAIASVDLGARRLGADDLWVINSTSGTTGLPKCVQHTQNRWRYFHQQAAANGGLDTDDVFLPVVPAPFGFGLWTSHATPILLGAATVLLDRFTPSAALEAIERYRVTVLGCVSTQFIMMLASSDLDQYDLSSLRVTFTGGEAVPFERSREFERRTGSTVLQFYGSNETGLLCGTTLSDTPERRLRTAGRIVPEMHVRLFDNGADVTESGRGQPACKGPATSVGYLDDAANADLFTADGWMLMGDICDIDSDGYLTVIGRTSDFIIRGGKNISALQVENDVATHPAVMHAAVVGMPDPIFGERVCAYVELAEDRDLDLATLAEHLASMGVSKELFPERLIVVDHLPLSVGAKVAKSELRADIARRLETERAFTSPAAVPHDVLVEGTNR